MIVEIILGSYLLSSELEDEEPDDGNASMGKSTEGFRGNPKNENIHVKRRNLSTIMPEVILWFCSCKRVKNASSTKSHSDRLASTFNHCPNRLSVWVRLYCVLQHIWQSAHQYPIIGVRPLHFQSTVPPIETTDLAAMTAAASFVFAIPLMLDCKKTKTARIPGLSLGLLRGELVALVVRLLILDDITRGGCFRRR